MSTELPPKAPPRDAPLGVRVLEPAGRFEGFEDAATFALDIITWRLPGSDPFITTIDGDDVSLIGATGGTGGPGATGYVAAPLVGSDGRQLGSLCILDREFPDADEQTVSRLLDAMGRILISELEREDREQSLRTLAEIDALTGLLNRRSFERVLAREWRRARHGERESRLLVADVNDLKPVNDELGHSVGDRLLGDVADAIREAARESDLAGRIGGDEFAIVLVGADELGEARFRERLAAALDRRVTRDVVPSVAIGGTSLAEAESTDVARELADRRMYRDKRRRFRRRALV